MKRTRALLVSSLLVAACGGSDAEVGTPPVDPATSQTPTDPKPSTPVEPPARDEDVDLRADTNRDGVVRFDDPADDEGEETWDAKHGAIFLANIDDDQEKCPTDVDDVDLPSCNDAADDVVNGADDVLDLARLATKPWPGAPDDAKATITTSTPKQVRLFKGRGSNFEKLGDDGALTIAELRSGIELAIEGKDIVRDAKVWDGYVDVTLSVQTPGGTKTDKVRMRVAPLLTAHHLQPALTTYVSQINSSSSQATRADLGEAATAAGVPAPKGLPTTDQWAQDFFETGLMTMPGPDGTQHAMRVNIRSANESNPTSAKNPLRRAGRLVFTELRGKDSAAIQQFDPTRNGRFDTLNSFGNFETIPPYSLGTESYPLGRVLRGNIPTYYPDKTFLAMIEAQRVQPPVYVDTSWLLVGHVDETMSFVKASTPRGWVLLVNDATLAKSMLEAQSAAGNGAVPMFVGKNWDSRTAAQVTIDQVLADTEVMQASAEAAVEVDAQLAIIKAATGLKDDEILRIPYLHMPYSRGSVAYQPGMVNGLYLSDTHFVAPDPHGPQIDGTDPFKDVMTSKLAAVGVTVHFAEDWDLYHRAMGEIHCGTNATRAVPTAKWWESGR